MKDPTAIGNYPHFYSTSCSSFSHPCFLSPFLSPFAIFIPIPVPSSGVPLLLRGRFLALDISATVFPSRMYPPLVVSVKSHVTHRRLPGRAGSPRGILPRHTPHLAVSGHVPGPTLSRRRVCLRRPPRAVRSLHSFVAIFTHLPPGLYRKYIFS